jgi:hypothetical protein
VTSPEEPVPAPATDPAPAPAPVPAPVPAADEAPTTVLVVERPIGPDGPDADEASALTPPPDRPRDPARRWVLVTVVFAIAAAVLTLLSITKATRFSALDEATHIDYAYHLAHFELVTDGEPLSQYTLNAWSCRGQANLKALPPCDSGAASTSYPGGGQQYNGFHPPVYYAITGWIARPLAAITGQDFITVARSLGFFWLLAAMLALYGTLRYWRVDWRVAFGAGGVLAILPTILHASTTVTNDAPSALFGVAAVFVLGRVLIYRNYGWILPAVITLLAVSTKILNGIGLLVVAGVLLLLALIRWRRSGFRGVAPLLRVSLAMILAAGVFYVIWSKISSGRQIPDWKNPILGVNTAKLDGLPFDEWLPTLFNGFRLGTNFYLDPYVNSAYLISWVTAAGMLFAVCSFVGLALFQRGTPRWILAGSVFLGCIAYPLVVQIQTSMNDSNYFPAVSTRYGNSLIPMAVAVIAIIVAHLHLRKTAAAVTGLGALAVLVSTAGWVAS